MNFFEGWPWFEFNNLGLQLAMALKFYVSVAKGLKLKLGKFWGINSYVFRSYMEKTGRGGFFPPPSILNRVNVNFFTSLVQFLLVKNI